MPRRPLASLPMGAHFTARFLFGFSVRYRAPLVICTPASGQGDLDLGAPVFEVRGNGHQGQRALLGLAGKVQDFALVKQELTGPVRVEHAEAARVAVGGYVHAVQPDLAVLGPGERVPQLHLAFPEGLHLAPDQHNPGLIGVQDLVIVTRPAVLGHHRPPVDLLRAHRPIKGSFVGVLLLARPLWDRVVAHCLDGLPLEACGLLAGREAEVLEVYPASNAAHSARLYTVEPTDVLRADRAARAAGWDLIGVWHSHTHTLAYPSPTDIEQAPDPDWHYVLVSLSDVEPVVRSYRIVGGRVQEEPVYTDR